MTIHDRIGADVKGFGGILRCTECGREQPLGEPAEKLRTGWPKCCGYTMRWITQRQLGNDGQSVPQPGGDPVGP